MRTIGGSAVTALGSAGVALVGLVEMMFTGGTLRLNTSRYDIKDDESPTLAYIASRLLGQVGDVSDVPGEPQRLTLSLSGLDPAIIAIALGEQVRGRPIRLNLAVLDASTHAMLDVIPLWAGRMATMDITQDPQGPTASIKLTAEHRGVLFSRAKPLRYTDADQRKLFAGDKLLEYIVSQSSHQDIWPAASYWKR